MALKRFCFTGTVKVELLAPIPWEGKEIKIIALDFAKVAGDIINWCESATMVSGNVSKMMPQFSSEYCTRLASCISDLPYKNDWDARYRIVQKMGYQDYDTLFQTVAAYIVKRNPQKFYDQFVKPDYDEEEDSYEPDAAEESEVGFTSPVEQPEESNTQSS